MLRSLVALTFVAWTPAALAQAAPPVAPAGPRPAAGPDDPGDDGEPPAKKSEAEGAKSGTPASEPPRRETRRPLPPPADPRGDRQSPRPFLARGSDASERHVEIGPDVGLWSRPARGEGASYAPGLGWGAHARAELHRHLGARVYFSTATHAVDVPRGALGLPGTAIDQPDLEVLQIGARAEPTLLPMPTLRLWAGLGVAWARATAPAPSSSGDLQIRAADRSGVWLEYGAALGATWDVVPDWLAVTLAASAGLVADPSGDLFHELAVGDGAGGTAHLAGLPELAGSHAVHLGVGMIL